VGDQARWLAAELSDSRSTNDWVIVQYHRPVYPAVKQPGSGLKSWVPLFKKFNVDLACEADGHDIKRTVPIRNGRQDASGVVYIGEGGLGVGQRTADSENGSLVSAVTGYGGQGPPCFHAAVFKRGAGGSVCVGKR